MAYLDKSEAIDLPCPGNAVRVVDREDATRDVQRGPPGKLMFSGPSPLFVGLPLR